MTGLTVAEGRDCALEMARWSGRRLATCEAHYFAATVRPGRAEPERARVLRERRRRSLQAQGYSEAFIPHP